MKFYLGTHRPTWLWRLEDVPLFISHRVLSERKTPFPRATTSWALDSGGFTELKLYGEWRSTPEEYVAAVRRYSEELGQLEWAAPQDWMCEPWIIDGGSHNGQHYAGTGLSVEEHQRLTTDNYLQLRELAPDLPFIPVLQGWTLRDYADHAEQYADAGIDLASAPVVGVGSVCRRQASGEIAAVFDSLRSRGLRLHGFGVKQAGLALYGDYLTSADSLAWSIWARHDAHKRKAAGRPTPPCGKETCAQCPHYALEWRDRLLRADATRQYALPLFG